MNTMKGLKPSLGNALSSLNMRLDHELARYRHAKRGAAPPTAIPQFRSRQRSLNLIGVPQTTSRPSSPHSKPATPPPVPPNPRLQQPAQPPIANGAVAGSHPPLADNSSTSEVAALRSALVRQPESAQPASPQVEENLASSDVLLESFNTPYAGQTPETITQPPEPNWLKQLNTPLGLGALLLLLVTSAGFGFILVNPVAIRHLVDRTPLARIWPNPNNEELAANTTDSTEATSDIPLGEAPLNPLSPDLSQQQFDHLNLNNLSSLPSAASRSRGNAATPSTPTTTNEPGARNNTPGTSPATAANQNASNTASAQTGPKTSAPQPVVTTVNGLPQPTTAPEPAAAPTTTPLPANPQPVAVPAEQPAPPPSQPTVTSEPAPQAVVAQPNPPAVVSSNGGSTPQDLHYVTVEYTGDASLEAAREVNEEAYLRNFDVVGARIQVDAFANEEAAATRVEELQNQGFEAQVYTPEAAAGTDGVGE
ncbi:MAG: hypothetical protein AAFQ89_18205 [Cyanobacteria bacterium J06626_18]